MKSSDFLRQEHDIIHRFLNILEKALFVFERDSRQPPGFIDFAIAFERDYINGYHHAKEEEILFPALERACDYREDLPLEELIHDHQLARDFRKKVVSAAKLFLQGERNRKREIIDYTRLYIQHIRYHSKREDRVLYPMTDRLLDSKTDNRLLAIFREKENENSSMIAYFDRIIETYENMPGF